MKRGERENDRKKWERGVEERPGKKLQIRRRGRKEKEEFRIDLFVYYVQLSWLSVD